MRSVTVRLDDLRTTVLNLGFVGENEHTQIRIDSKKMYDQYPTASASLTVCPPEGESYPAVIERDGDFVLWTITDSDLVHEGSGEIQLSFTVSEVVAKTYIGRFKVNRSIVPTGEIPEGIYDFLTRAGAALTAIPETIDEALAEAKASGEFDGPQGPAGQDGTDGQDGYSPTATVSKSGKVATITITDKNGTTTATVYDGEGGGTGDYADLTNKPQIAGVTLSGNKSLADLGADPTSIIDDTAGDGDTNKVWSADKSAALLSQINGKYEKPSGGIPSSDMTDAVQTSLGKADSAYQKPAGGIPATDIADSYIEEPSTDAQKIALQKLLSIYEAPWELIREDTVTNATEADIEITVDDDGNSFEITDAVLIFETPKQNTASGKGDYGIVRYYYGNNYLTVISSAWTQNANAAANGISSIVKCENDLVFVDIQQYTASGGSGNVRRGFKEGFTGATQNIQVIQDFAVTKVNITKVTGTGHYKLYGKRKWTV